MRIQNPIFVLMFYFSMLYGQYDNYDYCIIGAGPGGLQMAYLLQSSSRDYIVYEKSDIAGSFYSEYPRHHTLLSINKRYTGSSNEEFNLRHDWNSLISSNSSLKFPLYSTEYFPSSNDLVRYFNDYAQNLNIKYNHFVSKIKKINKIFQLNINYTQQQTTLETTCNYLLIGTGRSLPNIPINFDNIELSVGYENMNLTPHYYRNKSVAILGMGNTAFEIADSIVDYTSRIALYGASTPRLSYLTHYVGDVRAINSRLFDQYQLKSLDSIISVDIYRNNYKIDECNTGGYRIITEALLNRKGQIPSLAINCWDIVIRALGFVFDSSIFDNSIKPNTIIIKKKVFLDITTEYESKNIKNLYVIGELMHTNDYGKSAGGFIHGFRYLIKSLYHILEEKNHDVNPNYSIFNINNNYNMFISHLFKRINEASASYQMYGIIGDVLLFNDDWTSIKYSEDILLKTIKNKTDFNDYITWEFNFGDNFVGCSVIGFNRVRTNEAYNHGHCSGLLHPVFKFYHNQILCDQFGIIEDVGTDWTLVWRHINPFKQWFNKIIERKINSNWTYQPFEDCQFKNTMDQESKNARYRLVRQPDGTYQLKPVIDNKTQIKQKIEL